MHYVFLITFLSLGYSLGSGPLPQNGSHNLLNLQQNNRTVHRPARCTPCEESNFRGPISNHLEPEYRGNGADNLGYDWSSMAWGGPANPRKSKFHMHMPGRGGRMMIPNHGNGRVVCDTCRSYWYNGGRGGGGGRGGRDFFGGQPGYWQGDAPREDYEARVMSPTVGVLVKPGSRIAYIPSRSGEMYWDGISGGGTRWDGFSNGISWVGNAPEWDRSDSDSRDGKGGYDRGSHGPGNEYPYGPNGFGSWDGMKRGPSWGDGRGKGYYFTNGVANDIDPQWRDRGYASNWHYGSTNQNGWNGNNMKWNYGGKQWVDNDRAANRFYFNSPQDRNYGPIDGGNQQYGNQYPNYEGYPSGFRPRPSWPPSGYRPNDRFPATFPQDPGTGDKDKPWDYTSRDPSGPRRPGLQPEWMRPGPSYPPPGSFEGGSGRLPPNYGGYNKFPPSDRNDYEKPWNRPSGYGPSKPTPGGGFPYGGNRYPEDGGGRPGFSVGSGHLFIPNGDNRQPTYSNVEYGGNRPTYPTGNRKPGDYPGNQAGTYPGDGGRPYPDDRRPSVTYTGGRPQGGSGGYLIGGTSGGYPGSTPSYPNAEIGGSGSYLGGNRPSSGYQGKPYPSEINRPEGYPGSYPEGGRPGSYPEGGRPGSYPEGGRPGSYPEGSRPGGYREGSRPGSYPGSGGRPDSGYSGSSGSYPRPGPYPSTGGRPYYPGGSSRPDGYPQEGNFGGNQPTGYPSAGRPTGYPSENRPNEYQRPGYPSGGLYPGGSSGGYPQGGKNPPKGYYMGFITELTPDDGQSQYSGKNPNYFGGSYPASNYPGKDTDRYFYGGSYPGRPSSGDKSRYPAYSEDRYSGGGGGGGGYPVRDKDTGYDRGSDKYYYGQTGGKGKYPDGYPSNHRQPSGGDFEGNQGATNDKNSWNYGEGERKDGIYRRSGGSYPPYRGGQYYTSSYLASMPTTSGSTQAGTEPKTQTVTKADEVTESTLDSS